MYFAYVLLSLKDGRSYTGAASDLTMCLNEHETGKGPCARFRHPLRLIDYEACLDAEEAYRRERCLKTGRGKRYLRLRLEAWGADLDRKSWNGTRRKRFFRLKFASPNHGRS